jgi:hypothetical protein
MRTKQLSTPRSRVAMDADFSDSGKPSTPARESARKVDQFEELRRILGEQRSTR